MAELNIQIYDRTLAEVDKALEAEQAKEKSRNYLGMSQIGDECWRKLFYSFRKAAKRVIPASNLRAIQDGYIQEPVMAARLQMLPNIELHTVDPKNPEEQISFSLLLDHFKGHCDGMIKGILEAPQTWHVWEHKSVNQTKYNKLKSIREKKGEKLALKEWDIVYYDQAIIYMHESKTERHYLTVTTPGGRDYLSVRTEYNKKYAEGIITKAKVIIFDNWILPARLSNKREFFKCGWCDYQGICHDGKFADINCKTCRYSESIKDGETKCTLPENHDKTLENFNSCDNHLYNPALISAKFIEHQKDCCIYEIDKIKFANCILTGFPEVQGGLNNIYTSQQLKNEVKFINNIKGDVPTLSENPKIQITKKAWE